MEFNQKNSQAANELCHLPRPQRVFHLNKLFQPSQHTATSVLVDYQPQSKARRDCSNYIKMNNNFITRIIIIIIYLFKIIFYPSTTAFGPQAKNTGSNSHCKLQIVLSAASYTVTWEIHLSKAKCTKYLTDFEF
jgi:hypothetical protein